MDPALLRPWIEVLASSTVKVRPAMVRVPERPAPELAATWYVTMPLPDPVDPFVIVTQVKVLVLLHWQPDGAMTLIVPLPPAAVKVCPPRSVEKVQGEEIGRASCRERV